MRLLLWYISISQLKIHGFGSQDYEVRKQPKRLAILSPPDSPRCITYF